MIPVLGIPFYNRPDLLLRCLHSIDYPVERLVIVWNAPGGNPDSIAAAKLPEVGKLEIIRHPNAGVGPSWNEVMMLYPAPWWMFAGNDIQFTPGDLEKMAKAAWAHHTEYAALFGNHGHSFFIQTKRGTKNVGLYDPQLFPAYCEDCEWMWRLRCAGEKHLDVPGVNAIHGEMVRGHLEGSRTVNSDWAVQAENVRTHGNNFEYYRRKTGGNPGHETFTHPFNNPGIPVNFLGYDPDIRERNTWRLPRP